MSISGLAVIGLAGFLDLFRTTEPGPVMEQEEMSAQAARWIRAKLWIRIAIVVVIEAVLYAGSPKPVPPGSILVFMIAVPAVVIGIWIGERVVAASRRISKPRYDERELRVLQNATMAAYGVFWTAFACWCLAAMGLSRLGTFRLPPAVYPAQLFIGLWLILTTHSVSVLWQEWRAGR